MATELSRRPRSQSPPASSGRDSPLGRPVQRPLEDDSKRQDKYYRRYASGIDRALASFDGARLDWPDYISFLSRLLKAIQAHPPSVDSLPHRTLVANRLSYCLAPALPSGVHQKAIDVYAHIFSLIGKDALAQDLPVYLPGLSPVLNFASLSLRPAFLGLFEEHILKLPGIALRTPLKSLLLCLLPGLEEETSEDFARTLAIIDQLRILVEDQPYFWQCIFLASITSSSKRQGVLAVLNNRLPRFVSSPANDDVEKTGINGHGSRGKLDAAAQLVVSPEPGLLLRCFATGLRDEQYLIQRGFLDLLLTHLPLDSPVLCEQADQKDVHLLFASSVTVVARRDMSLNRRLWSWLLGPHADEVVRAESDNLPSRAVGSAETLASAYFTRFGAKPLTDTILQMVKTTSSNPAEHAKPFRLCLSLMDRWEISSHIVPKAFLPAISSLLIYRDLASAEDFDEVQRSASSFFDGVESGIIWGQMLELISPGIEDIPKPLLEQSQDLELADFIISTFNVREEEMVTVHEPLLALYILYSIKDVSDEAIPFESSSLIERRILILERIIQCIPEGANPNAPSTEARNRLVHDENTFEPSLLHDIQNFYEKHNGQPTLSPPPLATEMIGDLLVQESAMLYTDALRSRLSTNSIHIRSRIFSSVLSKYPDCHFYGMEPIISELKNILTAMAQEFRDLQFQEFLWISSTVSMLKRVTQVRTSIVREKTSGELVELLDIMVSQVWIYLHPSMVTHHIEAVRCLWQLDSILAADSIVEAAVSRVLAQHATDDRPTEARVDHLRRFMVLWTHTIQTDDARLRRNTSLRNISLAADALSLHEVSGHQDRLHRPLLQVIDFLKDGNSEIQYVVVNWLESLPEIRRIFHIVFERLGGLTSATSLRQPIAPNEPDSLQQAHSDESSQHLYHLQHLLTLLNLCSERSWSSLAESSDVEENGKQEGRRPENIITHICELCLHILSHTASTDVPVLARRRESLQQLALKVLTRVLQRGTSTIAKTLEIENVLISTLRIKLKGGSASPSLQISLLNALSAALDLRTQTTPVLERGSLRRRGSSMDAIKSFSGLPKIADLEGTNGSTTKPSKSPPPAELVKCLQEGISEAQSTLVLDHWIQFMSEILPSYQESIFENLIPLVECFCARIKALFNDIQSAFDNQNVTQRCPPEVAILSLLNGLEYLVATAHGRMSVDVEEATAVKSPEVTHGFFGNVVSGVFSADTQKGRSLTGNTRLTVVLCLQDALKVSFSIWSWASHSRTSETRNALSMSSLGYVSQRLRNRVRRILDRMYAAEALESLETLITFWVLDQASPGNNVESTAVLSLLHVLDSSRPKVSVPALFNAIYSRTSPSALDARSASTLTCDLSEVALAEFLVIYMKSMDDDAMDEIWTVCITFIKDVLLNPVAHHQILPTLLSFVVTLAEKVEKTNFGEQRKLRRELGDLFQRLLTATFTTRSGSMATVSNNNTEKQQTVGPIKDRSIRDMIPSPDLLETLTDTVPRLQAVLLDDDRLVTSVSMISTNVLSPLIHSKGFPSNMSIAHLTLLLRICKVAQTAKVWRKDVYDAFTHHKFFSTDHKLAQRGWAPVIRQWSLSDKDRVPEFCTKIATPTTAGIMFGVGAGAARLEADKKSQLNLRRIAMLIMASDTDFAVSSFPALEEKLAELLHASVSSSPSATTRAEVFMVLRALVQRTSAVHLAPFWPMITSELSKAIASSLPGSAIYDLYNAPSLLQACRLLDVLLAASPDDFQMQSWLFITDTIDAVYRPAQWEPIGLVDEVAEELGSQSAASMSDLLASTDDSHEDSRPSRPLLEERIRVSKMSKQELVSKVLRPFFAGLSINAYEAVYNMRAADWPRFEEVLFVDIFDDSTMVG